MKPFRSMRESLTPEVMLDPDHGTLSVTGECYPEDPSLFFVPVLDALTADDLTPSRLTATMRLSYVNSASAMWLRQLFVALDALAARGTAVNVAWEFDPDDDVSLELGHDLAHQLCHLCLAERPIVS